MKDYRLSRAACRSGKWFLILNIIVAAALSVGAQTPTDADAAMQRVARARALAASHNLTAAANELDSIINSTKDDAMRDVARIMLMHVYLEEANYTKADALLIETFQARSAQKESSIRSYFALAGQTVNGARAHLDRYRSFGINVADTGLPPEAVNDLDKLRLLLERVVEQAKEINNEGAKRSDAAALLEEAAGVRGTLARNEGERQQWQREIAGARESLAATETRIASNAVAAGASTPSSPAAAAPPTARTASAEARPTASPRQSDAHGSATQDSQLMNVGSLLDRATQKIAPTYPTTARSAHVMGVVTVYLEVDEKGLVVAVPRTEGPQMLKKAAEDAARKWKFRPTMIDGQPVRVTGFISFNFVL
ncbi:MAG TPA: energy transducer TonB [Pyrinomonadaceae bacterium]|nr:energy transducer TonB [Pyrinomonadaceae bacterium]